MGIFDIDSGADNHLLNEQFHVFSKSPASVATALGDASNRSGHTVTASDVWGQEIPAFFYAKTQAVADSYKSLAKTNDLCRIGNSVAIFENGNWVVKYNSYTDIPDGHKFKNANGDEVIRFHKNRLAYNLNLDNNAADDGLNTTAKIQGWDEENSKVYDYVATAPKFVTQFVTSTDKIVDGIPSKGFGPFVMAGTTTGDITKVLPEGTSDSNHYIANSFAGIIQFNKARTDAIYVHAFEYCGKTLKSAYSDIVELDEKLSKISVTAAGGVQALSDAAKSAGFEIEAVVADGVTTPTLDIETGSVATGVTKLVTGDAVNTAIKNAIDAIPEVQAATTEVAGVVTISTNDAIAIDATSTAAATVAAVAATRSEIAEEMGALTLAVTSAQGAAQEAAASATASATAAQNAQTAAQSAQSASETAASNASSSASSAAQSATSASNAETAAKAAQTAAEGSATSASQSASAAQTAQQQATASAQSAAQAATDAKAAKDFVEALTIPEISTVNSGDQLDINDHVIEVKTSTFTAQTGTSTSIGSMTANENGLATGATVVAVANDALRAAKAYSNSLHTTSVTYHVTDTLPTVPAGKEEEYKGRIYLVLTGVDGVKPADGDRIEYMYVQENGVWGWEQIGTTTADLSAYAKTADLNATNVGSGAVKVSQTDGKVSSVTVATEALVDNNAIKTSVSDANALVKAGDALAAIKLAKPDNYVASVTGYTAEGSQVTTTQGAAVKVLDGRGTSVTANDLWSTTATLDENDNLTVAHNWVTKPNPDWDWTPWNGSITKVENNKAYVNDTLYGNIQTEMIKDGYCMFYNTNLSSFSSDLSSLMDGNYMFYGGNKLNSFTSYLPSLTVGYKMFAVNDSLTSFTSYLPSLTNGYGMFDNCKNLNSFTSDLPSLTNGDSMFNNCVNLTAFKSDLSSLTDGEYMFYGCKRLSSLYSHLSNLTYGRCMFYGALLSSFSSDLSNLREGSSMFGECSSLSSFSSDLSSLTEGSYMFGECRALTTFNTDLPSLTNGNMMFASCSNLTSFCGDLSSLRDGSNMFSGCDNLTSFCGDLSSLTSGDAMFYNCKLDTDSIECIADTINTVSSGRINIKIGNTTPNDEEDAAFKQMQTKGWKVYVNGSNSNYVPRTGEASLDETGETTVAPKPYWAKPIEVAEDKAEYVGQDGKFYQVVGGQFIYVSDPDTYGMFVSLEDAVDNMRLTKYVKPVEEETEAQA